MRNNIERQINYTSEYIPRYTCMVKYLQINLKCIWSKKRNSRAEATGNNPGG